MSTKITYWGFCATKLVAQNGTVILIDPALSENPYAPVKAEEIDKADAILVSHLSWDHLGDAFELAKRTGAPLIGGSETMAYARRAGIPREKTLAIAPGGRRMVGDITVVGTLAIHVSFTETADGQFIAGQPLGFIVMTPDGDRIYHSGDTWLFGDMKLIAELYRPKVGLFSVGAPKPGSIAHITPYESALACQWLGVDTVIPTHYCDPKESEEFRNHLATLAPKARMVVLEPGEEYETGGR